jgi:hypothetical protein
MRSFAIPASLLATLYLACVDPPKKNIRGGAGTGGELVAEAGSGDEGGTTATSGTGGSGGRVIAEGGEGGVSQGMGGEAGFAEAGEGGASGAAPIDRCITATIGKSMLPAPLTSGIAKPAGTPGNLQVVNWAGFKGAISYTFDDNLQSQITHYAALHAVGVPMTFYVVGATHGLDSSCQGWPRDRQPHDASL